MPDLTVQFINRSYGKPVPTSYDWDFGDGDTSTSENPEHTFPSSGSYDVTLTIENGVGQASKTRTVVVVAGSGVIARFTYTVGESRDVHFIDDSYSPVGIASWDWDFGDGSSHSSSQNPTHTYSGDGPYLVTLIITDNGSASDSETKYVSAANHSYWLWGIDLESSLEAGILSIWYDAADWVNGLPPDYTLDKLFAITIDSGNHIIGTGIEGTAGFSCYWYYPSLCANPTIKVWWGRNNTGGSLQKVTCNIISRKIVGGPTYGSLNATSPYIGTGLVACNPDGTPWSFGASTWELFYPDDILGNKMTFYRSTGSGSGLSIWSCRLELGNYGHHVLGD